MIRLAQQNDCLEMLNIYRPYIEESATSFEVCIPSLEEFSARIWRYKAYPWYVASEADKVCGYAYATPYRSRAAYQHTAEVSVYVGLEHQGRGIGRLLYAQLFTMLKRSNHHALVAGVTLPNEASVNFHESMGFAPVGVFKQVGFKFDRWHDVGFWQRTL